MKSKRGALVYNWTLTLMIIFILGWAYLQFYSKYTKNEPLGTKQIKLFKTYAQGESALFYIDQSAKYSLQQAVYDLAKNGGISEIDITDSHASATYECGRFKGAFVWYEIRKDDSGIVEKSCIDEESLSKNLQFYFNENMNKYLGNYPKNLPQDNYIYEVKNNLELIGHAIEPLKFDIFKQQTYETIYDKRKIQEISEGTTRPDSRQITMMPNIPVSYKYRLDNLKRPSGTKVDRIVLHHTGDDAASKTYNTLLKRGLSIHYIIDRDGTIYYVLDENKIAYHAENWNRRSIGIEVVNTGYADMEYTQEQYDSIKNLINDLSGRWPDIKTDNGHVIAHYQSSTTGKWDPSPNFDWTKIGLADHTTLVALGKSPPAEFGYA